nr:MAG TPA: hypothetical protein [Caudoviricetes sp.]
MSDADDIREVIERLSLYGHTGARTGLRDDILALVSHTIDLEVEAREKNAWEGRYNALLEECENSRPREYVGNGRDLAYGSVVIDREGDAWQRYAYGGWSCYMVEGLGTLPAKHAPYTIVYTPKEES